MIDSGVDLYFRLELVLGVANESHIIAQMRTDLYKVLELSWEVMMEEQYSQQDEASQWVLKKL